MLRPAVPQLVCRLIAFLSGEACLFCSQIVNSQIGSLSIRALYLTDPPHTALSVCLTVCLHVHRLLSNRLSINKLPEASVKQRLQLVDYFSVRSHAHILAYIVSFLCYRVFTFFHVCTSD